MSFVPYDGGEYQGWPRFSPQAWTAAETTTYIIAIGAAFTRTALRLYYFRKINADDIVMFVALITLTAVFGLSCFMRDYIYGQVAMNLGLLLIPEDPIPLLRLYMKYMAAVNTLTWFTIFTVKISYMVFFWRLIDRVRWMVILWWTVFVFVLSAGIVCVILPPTNCTHLDDSMFQNCSYISLWGREEIDLRVNVALDISTDIAVISVPLALLYQVRLTLVRKMAISAILCLSAVMIVIASIRLSHAMLAFGVTDTVWQSFWQTIEANVAVTMVSITGFRSLFGQVSRQTSSNTYPSTSARPFMRRGSSHLSSSTTERQSPIGKNYIEKTVFVRTTTQSRHDDGLGDEDDDGVDLQPLPLTFRGYERQPVGSVVHAEMHPHPHSAEDGRDRRASVQYWGQIEALRPLPSVPKRM